MTAHEQQSSLRGARIATVTLCLVANAAIAQVHRCDIGGRIVYSDVPCSAGTKGRSVDARPNSVPAVPAAAPRVFGSPQSAIMGPSEHRGTEAPAISSCPSDTDLRNIETRLSASVVPAKNRQALHQERAKAESCRSARGRYAYEDWRRLEAVLRGDD